MSFRVEQEMARIVSGINLLPTRSPSSCKARKNSRQR